MIGAKSFFKYSNFSSNAFLEIYAKIEKSIKLMIVQKFNYQNVNQQFVMSANFLPL
jgi:hypothetical protein